MDEADSPVFKGRDRWHLLSGALVAVIAALMLYALQVTDSYGLAFAWATFGFVVVVEFQFAILSLVYLLLNRFPYTQAGLIHSIILGSGLFFFPLWAFYVGVHMGAWSITVLHSNFFQVGQVLGATWAAFIIAPIAGGWIILCCMPIRRCFTWFGETDAPSSPLQIEVVVVSFTNANRLSPPQSPAQSPRVMV